MGYCNGFSQKTSGSGRGGLSLSYLWTRSSGSLSISSSPKEWPEMVLLGTGELRLMSGMDCCKKQAYLKVMEIRGELGLLRMAAFHVVLHCSWWRLKVSVRGLWSQFQVLVKEQRVCFQEVLYPFTRLGEELTVVRPKWSPFMTKDTFLILPQQLAVGNEWSSLKQNSPFPLFGLLLVQHRNYFFFHQFNLLISSYCLLPLPWLFGFLHQEILTVPSRVALAAISVFFWKEELKITYYCC